MQEGLLQRVIEVLGLDLSREASEGISARPPRLDNTEDMELQGRAGGRVAGRSQGLAQSLLACVYGLGAGGRREQPREQLPARRGPCWHCPSPGGRGGTTRSLQFMLVPLEMRTRKDPV